MHYGEPLESPLEIILTSNGGTASPEDFHVLRFRANGTIDTLHNGDTFYFPEGDTLMNLRMEVAEEAQFAPNEVKTVQLIFKSILCPFFRYLDGTVEERAQYDTLNYVIIDNNRFTLTHDLSRSGECGYHWRIVQGFRQGRQRQHDGTGMRNCVVRSRSHHQP